MTVVGSNMIKSKVEEGNRAFRVPGLPGSRGGADGGVGVSTANLGFPITRCLLCALLGSA